MGTRRITIVALALAAFILGAILQPFNHYTSFAQSDCQTFKETGDTVCGRFLQYWQNNGGLAQKGYPISNEFQEVSALDGQTYSVQYFERAVFEYHPGNQPPYDVLLSQLGTLQYRERYPNGDPSTGVDQAQLPSRTVRSYFDAGKLDAGVAMGIQRSLMTSGLLYRLDSDPHSNLLGNDFPRFRTLQDAPRRDFSGNGPAWVLLINDVGDTVAVFTMVKEDGTWKIDYVEPNALQK